MGRQLSWDREMAGEWREGVSTYIKCNNQKKTNLWWGWAHHTHPHPVVVVFSSPPGLPFVLSYPGVISLCLGPSVDVVEGGGRGVLMLRIVEGMYVTAGS